jgi:hypothetical protein
MDYQENTLATNLNLFFAHIATLAPHSYSCLKIVEVSAIKLKKF